jgi:hypothetical protein
MDMTIVISPSLATWRTAVRNPVEKPVEGKLQEATRDIFKPCGVVEVV